MIKEFYNKTKLFFSNNISYLFLTYWLLLCFWQITGLYKICGILDIAFKLLLLAFLIYFILIKSHKLGKNAIYLLPFLLLSFITMCIDKNLGLRTLISYFFPIIILFLVYGFGDNFEINKKELRNFCNVIIFFMLFSVCYAIVFLGSDIIQAITATNAYSNEFKSFFLSSHEYGLYLSSAIICCLMCLRLDNTMPKKSRIFYIASMLLLFFALILTFSRTSLVGLCVFLLFFCINDKGKMKKILIWTGICSILFLILYPNALNYVLNVVFKKNNLAGRDSLLVGGFKYFNSGNFIQKMFGHGIGTTESFLDLKLAHASTHNFYLDSLLYYGIFGIVMIIAFLVNQIITRFKLKKIDNTISAFLIGLIFMGMMILFTNTTKLFASSIDSYFFTLFIIIIPKFVANSVKNDNFNK